MKYRSSLETSIMIIGVLMDNKEFAQYDMPKPVGKDYRTILRHLKKLEYHKLIKIVRTDPAKKSGKEKNIFALTVDGLIFGLKVLFGSTEDPTELAENMEKLAATHKDLLPLILGKWDFWKKEGFENLILERLKKALVRTEYPYFFVMSTPTPYKGEITTGKNLLKTIKKIFGTSKFARDFKRLNESRKNFEKATDELTQYNLYRNVFVEYWNNRSEKLLKIAKREELNGFINGEEQFKFFLKSLVKDIDLRIFVDIYFLDTKGEYEDYLKNIDEWNTFWVSLKTEKETQ